MNDLENLSGLDMSENHIIEKTKLANKKLEILHKQISILEQTRKLERLMKEDEDRYNTT